MYLGKSLIDGLNILGFDKETIARVSREKNLEEIFLSTLFLNYLIVLLVYLFGLLIGGYSIQGQAINMPVFFGMLMIYPFVYNIVIYFIYGFFALMAEMLDKKKHTRPLISVGFHTAIVYSIVLYIIGMISTYSTSLAAMLSLIFFLYFIYTMFLSISTIYRFSLAQSLIVLFIPFLLVGLIMLIAMIFYPDLMRGIIGFLFA